MKEFDKWIKDKELGEKRMDNIKDEMWDNALKFLQKVDGQDVRNIEWKYGGKNGIESVEIIFMHQLYESTE